MALSIRNIISQLNTALNAVFNDAKFYGVATSVERQGVTQPVVDEKDVSIDDTYGLQMYHKLNAVQITYPQGRGFGDKLNTINTFGVSAFVFNNERKTKLKADEIAMIIQATFSNIVIQSVRIIPVSFILNTPVIYSQEYRGVPFTLGEYQTLLQFNYQVEITFKSGCFDLCPEDFSQCKN